MSAMSKALNGSVVLKRPHIVRWYELGVLRDVTGIFPIMVLSMLLGYE
jgi:hypothetical protein